MAYFTTRIISTLMKPPNERTKEELFLVEPLLVKKSKLFATLKQEVLKDVVKHCENKNYSRNELITYQGEKGDTYYIILSGRVSIYIRDIQEDSEDDNKKEQECAQYYIGKEQRAKLGSFVCHLDDGHAFGEVALINPDCIRTASVVADETSYLIAIDRELYNRSISNTIKKDFDNKYDFIQSHQTGLFRGWPYKWRRHLAFLLDCKEFGYDETLTRQGGKADKLYFIVDGEVQLTAEPELHRRQFPEYHEHLVKEEEEAKELRKFRPRTAVPSSGLDGSKNEFHKSRSAIRLKSFSAKVRPKQNNICYIGNGKIIGDVEFLLQLDKYVTTAKCLRPTRCLTLHSAYFNNLFRKKHPFTLKYMAEVLTTEMQIRIEQPKMLDKMYMLQFLLMRLKELHGPKKIKQSTVEKDNETWNEPLLVEDPGPTAFVRARLKSAVSTKSAISVKSATSATESTNAIAKFRETIQKTMLMNRFKERAFALLKNRDREEEESEDQNGGNDLLKQINPALLAHARSLGGSNGGRYQRRKNFGDGIFLKLMSMSDPSFDRKKIKMNDDEFEYLVQLRRRLATQMDEIGPTSLIALKNQQGETKKKRIERPCHVALQTSHLSLADMKKNTLPTINPTRKSALKSSNSNSPQKRNRVLFDLPPGVDG